MRNSFKLQIISCISFVILISLNLKAQKEFTPEPASKNQPENSSQLEKDILKKMLFIADQKNETQRKHQWQIFNNSPIKEDYSETPGILSKRILSTFHNIQLTEDALDSVIYSRFGDRYKNSFTYDDNLKRLTWLSENWNSNTGIWINDRRRTYTNDSSGNLLTSLYEDWDSNAGIWLNDKRETNTYDGSGNLLTSLLEEWDSNAGIWVNSGRLTATYDSSGNLLTLTVEDWDIYAGIWVNDWRETNTYNGNGNRLTWLWEVGDNITGIWVNSERETYTYDGNGNRLTYFNEYWDIWTSAGTWVNFDRATYTYDYSGNLLTYFREYWDSNAGIWVIDGHETYTYDGSGNLLTVLHEYWDSNAGIWVNSWRRTHTYDSIGNLILFNSEAWSGSSWYASYGLCSFINNGYEHYYWCEELSAYYSPVTSIDNSGNNVLYGYSLSQNYPNPFNPTTKIKYTLPKAGTVKIEIFNLLGQKIETLLNDQMPAGSYEIEFTAKDLPSGVYLYRIEAGEFQEMKKMVLVK